MQRNTHYFINKHKKNGTKRLHLFVPFFSDLGGVRTPNHQSRNLIFYPVELRGHLLT